MSAADVCGFLDLMDARGIRIWLDGGWAVDACLGSQTRRHRDLDIVIEKRDVSTAAAMLQGQGYAPVPRLDTRAWNFVLGDGAGHQIDFHVIVLDEHGRGLYGPPDNAESYPAEALTGRGTVQDRAVDCITPEWLVRFHTGYEVDAADWADIFALCQRFGIPVPREYLRFQRNRSPPALPPARRSHREAQASRRPGCLPRRSRHWRAAARRASGRPRRCPARRSFPGGKVGGHRITRWRDWT